MNYSDLYLSEASKHIQVNDKPSGSVGWNCPSNIALIKYWGKQRVQLPINPSISFTLSKSLTRTTVKYEFDKSNMNPTLELYFENKRETVFEERIFRYLKNLEMYLPYLANTNLLIQTQNSFPHSAGIASSASSFGALALCLISIEEEFAGFYYSPEELNRKASFIARLGSGSASRSLYGGVSVWGYTDSIKGSSDEIALPIENCIHSIFRNYNDVILIIDDSGKPVSSSNGHQLMQTNPYAEARLKQANVNFNNLLGSLKTGDITSFIDIVENEALSLHAMMLTSNPGFFLVKQSTIDVINRVRRYRKETNVPLAFTLDAGPNVHLLFPEDFTNEVNGFINSELVEYCKGGRYINDGIGSGPQKNRL